MNEKQPYEKQLAEKLESVQLPGDSSKHWPDMKAMLDQQMPKSGRRPGGSWWMYGIIAGIVLVGTWLATKQSPNSDKDIAQNTSVTANETKSSKSDQIIKGELKDGTITPPNSVVDNSDKSTPVVAEAENDHPENSTNSKTSLNSTNDKNATLTSDSKPTKTASSTKNDILRNPKLPETKLSASPLTEKVAKNASGKNKELKVGESRIEKSKRPTSDQTTKLFKKTNFAVREKLVSNAIKQKEVSKFNLVKNDLSDQRKKREIDVIARTQKREDIAGNPALLESTDDIRSSSIDFANGIDLSAISIYTFMNLDSIRQDYSKLVQPTAVAAKSRFKESSDRVKSLKNRVVGTGEAKNFVIGLTLPLSMPLSDQRVLSYNVNAGINTISDYIPSPNLQYHFNQTSYLQAEIQLASPQFIQPVLLSQSKYELSGQTNNYRFMTKSVFAKKLYYFNLPIGVHYSPFKNFYLGTGLQFSSLMSGIGFSETRGYTSLGPSARDTLTSASFFKFKNDTLSGRLNSNEIRLTLDANYYWKRFALGLRYNQALNNYVSIQVVPNTPVFTDRNKALQIYLRYNLWEDKKKKKTGSVASK